MIHIFGFLVMGLTMFLILFRPKIAILCSSLLVASEFGLISVMNYNTISKMMVLLTVLYVVFKFTQWNKVDQRPIILLVVLFIVNACLLLINKFLEYGFKDFITSFATISMGVLVYYVNWTEKQRLIGFKILAWLSVFCVSVGTIEKGTLFDEAGRFSSATSLWHTPAMVGTAALISSLILSKKYKISKYKYMVAVNFVIIVMAQVRGALIFASIILIPFIFEYLKKLKIKQLIFFIIFIPIVIYFLNIALQPIIERSFTSSTGKLNTSGRFEAWEYWWEKSSPYRVLGMGIGSMKTSTDEAIVDNFTAAHNEYLRFIVESGIIGLVIIIVIIYILWRHILKYNILNRNNKYILFYMLGFMCLAFTDNVISSHRVWFIFSLCLSLMSNGNVCLKRKQYVDSIKYSNLSYIKEKNV